MGKRMSGLWADFKAFINKGNVMGLAVAVVLGGAFGAVVNAVAQMLLSVATWGVPGGLGGLITVLPPANATQSGYESLIIPGVAGNLHASYTSQEWINLKVQAGSGAPILDSLYVARGGSYYYKNLAVIDWGNLINTVISFLVVAIVLFTIIKVATSVQKKAKKFGVEGKTSESLQAQIDENKEKEKKPSKKAKKSKKK